MSLAGRVAIVTGAASGIGRAIAARLAADGATVCVADIAAATAEAAAGGIEGAFAHAVDMTDESAVDALIAAVVARCGRLDVMVNNAGTIAISPLVDTELSTWQRLFKVNVDSVFLGSRAAARQMIAQGHGGVIINAASGGGKRGGRFVSHYCATKAAVILMTQSLALELAPHRIRANCYAPGHIDTPMWGEIAARLGTLEGRSAADVLAGVAKSVPWGRMGTPEDVAAVVGFLAGDAAEYVSGQTLMTNGAEQLS